MIPPDRIPEPGRTLVVATSGGKDSAAMALWLRFESGLADTNPMRFVFNDTGHENPLTVQWLDGDLASRGRLRASRARKDYINKAVKALPWDAIGVLGIEDLNNLKLGKKPGRGKRFRKAVAPWTYRQAIARIEMLAQENRVRLVAVDPRNTSRQCPRCGTVAKENRRGEDFLCVRCNYSADADFVGAQNVLARTLGNSGQSMVARCLAA